MGENDVIVVGSGPTAAAAAVQLAERNVSCTVVNDGRHMPPGLVVKLRGRTIYRRDKNIGLEQRGGTGRSAARWFVSSALGGLSNYWTAATPRFDPDDFAVHGRVDRSWRWPLGYDDLAPWYDAAERILELTGAAEVEWRGRSKCLKHTRRTPADWQQIMRGLPYGCQLTTSAIGPPELFARRPREHESHRTVLRRLERAGRITLLPGLDVRRILWDRRESRARGVAAVDIASGESVEVGGRHVLLCAGTIGSVSILNRSRSTDHPNGMGNARGLLGRYVTDHPSLWFVLTTDRALTTLDQPLQIRQAATDDHPYGWQYSLGLVPGTHARLRAWLGRAGTTFGLNAFGTQLPEDRQTFIFDDNGLNLRDMDYSYRPESLDALTHSIAEVREALADQGLGTRVGDVFIDRPGGSVHWSGGARMHADPAFGVVDGFGRLHDSSGVSVCDASTFTTLPEKNPTLTAMALAMRAANQAIDDLSDN